MPETVVTLPITLVGETLRVLVVGGGAVGTRKVETLLAAGITPVVITVAASSRITELAQKKRITLIERAFRNGDTKGFYLVVVATNDRDVASVICAEVLERGGLVNCADDPAMGNVHFPAVFRDGPITVAVSTTGQAPGLAAYLRDRVRAAMPHGLAEALSRLAAWRRDGLSAHDARTLLRQLPLTRLGAIDDDKVGLENILRGPGSVILVGAGPGDPELLTLAGAAALARADVVLYDMLVNTELLRFAPADATFEFVGKTAGGEYTPQSEINVKLYEPAAAGRTVVRLKGGDPFLFGRGAEEWRYLTERGVRVECVSGVSSAFAAITAAGFALTERERCDSIFVTTGHRSVSPGTRLVPDYDPGLTAVVLMATKSLAEVVDAFRAHGWSEATPVLIISRATMPDQRHVATTLGDAVVSVSAARLATPALLAVGDALADPITTSQR